MAYIVRRFCPSCKDIKDFSEGGGGPQKQVCSECEMKADTEALQAHLAALRELPFEERLRRIEEWIYRHTKNHPQEQLRY